MRDTVRASGAGRASGAAPVSRDWFPLVVPVVSGAGGVGRSVLAALLAAALSDRATDAAGRAVAAAVCDVSPRGASPWPDWVDKAAGSGTAVLAASGGQPDVFARELRRSISVLGRGDDGLVWVLTDTGPPQPEFTGTSGAPLLWKPLLRHVPAAIIDADPLEGSRLARQCDGGPLSTVAAWLTEPSAWIAAVWVTEPSPAGLARTLAAVTAAERCGLPTEQFVVAINDVRGHGWMPRSRSRRTLLTDRVGAIVEIGHDNALRDGGRPGCSARDVESRDIARLAAAVIAAAKPGVAAPALNPDSPRAFAERAPCHVASVARPVSALG